MADLGKKKYKTWEGKNDGAYHVNVLGHDDNLIVFSIFLITSAL